MLHSTSLSRRDFVRATLLTAGTSFALNSSQAAGQTTGPNSKLQLGIIGLGVRGNAHLTTLLGKESVQIVALCDVDEKARLAAKQEVDTFSTGGCTVFEDFREMIGHGGLDAVAIAVPDHWHALIAIACAEAGIDVYGEIPLAHTIKEGRAVVQAMTRYGRVFQAGSWQRSDPFFQRACSFIADGRLGPIHLVEVGTLGGVTDLSGLSKQSMYQDPEGLNYDLWLGPAPWLPYHPGRVHQNWRWHLDYGGGQLTSWAAHHVDIALWAMGLDTTGPLKVEATGTYATTDLWNAPSEYDISATFFNALRIRISSRVAPGIRWHGQDGWIYVDRNQLKASRPDLLQVGNAGSVTQFNRFGTDHWQNFLDAVRYRHPTISPCESAHRVASVAQLGLIALLTNREFNWKPDSEVITQDPGANELLGKAYREPWLLLD